MITISFSKARINLNRLIDQTNTSHQPIHISNKFSGAVLLSAEDWRAVQKNTLFATRTKSKENE
jgi:prevent-host-death family protein